MNDRFLMQSMERFSFVHLHHICFPLYRRPTYLFAKKKKKNAGRDGLTHNMLNDIHNNWKHAEAVRIKCLGVPTVDMNNVCAQIEVTFDLKSLREEQSTVHRAFLGSTLAPFH